MLLVNDVYKFGNKQVRLLWKYENIIVWIDINDPKALPQFLTANEFEHLLADEQLLQIDDPFIKRLMSGPKKNSRSEKIQIKAWNIIEKLVSTKPDIFKRNKRGKLVLKAMKSHEVTNQTIYRYLRFYWQRGNTINALNPDYENCGSVKNRKAGEKKRGRPRTSSPGKGVNIDN